MSVSKPIHAVLFLLSIFSIKLSCCNHSNSLSCLETEKQSLLTFKKSLKDPYNMLSSWDGEVDCCKWKGVVCENATGHVHQLLLQGRWLQRLSGKLNPSLLNLKHLTHLDLSLNNFTGETIPSFIGSFTNLEYLDLSDASFQGRIPQNIGNLSNLGTLNLGGLMLDVDSLEWLSGLSKLEYLDMNYVDMSRATNWAQVINNLPSLLGLDFIYCSLDLSSPVNNVNLSTSLAFLDLSYNLNFNRPFPFLKWVFHLNNLIFLDLSFNSFEGEIPTLSNATKLVYIDLAKSNLHSFPDVSNATKLQFIDLSGNNINSSIPDWVYFCRDLEFLSLSFNDLHGKISELIWNLNSLQTLSLSHNQLSGKLPRGIANLCRIQSLYLSSNELQGEVHDLFGNMSQCFLGSLKVIYLDSNQLSGHLPNQFGELKSLRTLDLGSNSLSGAIPISLGNLSSLVDLCLDDNKFTGNIPESLGQLLNLDAFRIANNKLEGIVTESHFTNLSSLKVFKASGNHLTLNVDPNWIPPFQLVCLGLGSWSVGVEIPSWIQKQKNIDQLDLSNTGISGTIPPWYFGFLFLNVSNNNLHGNIPRISSPDKWQVQYMFLSSNKFSGSLPQIGRNVVGLDLSHNLFSNGISDLLCDTTYETYRLQILDLEGNQLSGELPDCLNKWPELTYLKLGNTTMSGRIPNSIGFLVWLESLSLYSNKFSGPIPFSMHNCKRLLKIDLSDNSLDGNLPAWIGTSLVDLKILILRSNNFGGEISSEICHLQSLHILDLSNNRFSGTIPRCVCKFNAMATPRVLKQEFVNNATRAIYSPPTSLEGPSMESASVTTKGVELEYSTILSLVTNIDLSMNNLSGEIPKELTSLVGLGSLNLSANHFTGAIPESIGDMKQLESLDLSRNSLSGEIPNGFTLLTSLSHLNLSFNKLTGRIPESTQLRTLEASSFVGNDLCGLPLARNCTSDGDNVHRQEEEQEGEESEMEWLYVVLSLGYVLGFSAACTALVLNKSWRYAYFRLLECLWDNIYLYFSVKWAKIRKLAAPGSQ